MLIPWSFQVQAVSSPGCFLLATKGDKFSQDKGWTTSGNVPRNSGTSCHVDIWVVVSSILNFQDGLKPPTRYCIICCHSSKFALLPALQD